MTWLYVVLAALVVASVPATWWLKRTGDRAWEEYQWRRFLETNPQVKQLGASFARLQVDIATAMTPVLQEIGKTAAEMARAIENNPGLKQLGRELAAYQRKDNDA